METVESAGDLYIDVAEAYAENGETIFQFYLCKN